MATATTKTAKPKTGKRPTTESAKLGPKTAKPAKTPRRKAASAAK